MEVLTRWFGAERPLSQRDPEFSLSRSSANSGPSASRTCAGLALDSYPEPTWNDAVTTNRATAESWWSSKPRGQARLKAAAPRDVNPEKAAQAAKTAFEKTTVKEANGGEGKVNKRL